MSFVVAPAITRRSFLIGAASTVVAVPISDSSELPAVPLCATSAPLPASLPNAAAGLRPAKELKLVAVAAQWPLVGNRNPDTDVWCYDGRIPGPEIRLRQGEPVRITVENKLEQDTTVHWHGIRLPIAMDGVPGLTQPPIRPGESFVYEFTPPDAGTFWYHPHANSLQQLGRGMAGALIVEEPQPVAVDRDIVWLLADWRLRSDAQIASGFGNPMEAAMSGRIGNTVTVNGAVSEEVRVRAGERIRLRLINGALARMMALRFDGHRPVVVAIDGQPCDPHEPERGRVLLGPAMRVDVVLDMQGEPGRRYQVIDDFYDGLSYWLTQLAYEDEPPVRAHPLAGSLALPRNPLPEPDLATAGRHALTLQGGMMSGGGMGGMGMQGMDHGATWAINGRSMTGDGHAGMAPLLTLKRGRSYVLTIRNETAFSHPVHFHGHSFRVLSRNASPVPHRQWADTVLLPPKETVDLAFVADNPGDWMLHCHVTDHQVSGLMTVLRVA
jgi:FtsP/CotA-like multicopper oxidase with cupredoxin domain